MFRSLVRLGLNMLMVTRIVTIQSCATTMMLAHVLIVLLGDIVVIVVGIGLEHAPCLPHHQ